MELTTQYLGLKLKNPFIVGASPLADQVEKAKRLADAGAAAIVMHSLFEEQIIHHQSGADACIDAHCDGCAEASSFFPKAELEESPELHVKHLRALKNTVSCPVIASINGVHRGTWAEYAGMMEQAGADAVELNIYFCPMDFSKTSNDVEQEAIDVVKTVKKAIKVPLAVKLSPFYSALPRFILNLQQAGANGVVLFNRLFQPNIDIEKLETVPEVHYSTSSALFLRLRWAAALYKRIQADIAITGGVLHAEDAIKAIMAGANVVQVVSTLLMHGPDSLKTLIENFEKRVAKLGYENLDKMRGAMSYINTPNPDDLERANYVKILKSWH